MERSMVTGFQLCSADGRPFDTRHRFMGAVFPAAAVTLGLTFLMSALVSVDYERPLITESRVIERIVPEERGGIDVQDGQPPKPIEAAVKPPPPPAYKANKSDIDLPLSAYAGQVPAEPAFEVGQIASVDIPGLAREPVPLAPLTVSYPTRELARGLEGDCLVRFDIDSAGYPSNVVAECTSTGFERAARSAVARARFAPRVVDGKAVRQAGVAYPIVFRLQDR
ncbi:MAG: TonB family protein [Pseudomonadota bacterium]